MRYGMTESTKPVEDLYTLQPDAAADDALRLEPAEGAASAPPQEKEPSYGCR